MSNVTVRELKKQLDREMRAKTILFELNDYANLRDSMTTVLKHFKEITECDAIGLRLYNGKDYPYYAYEGLPEAFVMRELALCSLCPGIKSFKLPDNRLWSTECLCSDIINGDADRSLPFFTMLGNFYYNNLPNNIQETNTKKCVFFCFKSMAIIRVISEKQCVGLIQLFSHKPIFSYDLVAYLENIASYIGMAIYNNISYTKMKEAYDTLNQLIPMCSHCKKVNILETEGDPLADKEEEWQPLEELLQQQVGIEFTHTICSDCLEILYPEIFAKMQKH